VNCGFKAHFLCVMVLVYGVIERRCWTVVCRRRRRRRAVRMRTSSRRAARRTVQGRSRRSGRSGHSLTTFSATKFFYYSSPFKVIAQPPPPYDITSTLHEASCELLYSFYLYLYLLHGRTTLESRLYDPAVSARDVVVVRQNPPNNADNNHWANRKFTLQLLSFLCWILLLVWLASILWSHHEETREKEIMQGTMPGARRRKPRKAWMDNIKTWTKLPVEESIRMTEDRDKWRK